MISIFGELGRSVLVEDILSQIQNEKGEEIELIISSGGGDAFGGLAIYDALKATGKKVKVNIFGICASASSIIAMAGDEIVMGKGAMLMIHCASAGGGNAKEMANRIEILNKLDERMTDIYSAKTKKEKEFIKTLMEKETYMSAEDALQYGFISILDDKNEMVAKLQSLTINKKEESKTMDNENNEKVSAGFVAKVLETLGFKAKAEVEQVPEKEVEKPVEAVEAMEETPSEAEMLKQQIAELTQKLAEIEGEKVKEMEVEVEAKSQLIFTALQENKITIAKAKDLFTQKSDKIQASLQELAVNANGFGSTGKPQGVTVDSPEEIYASYQSATGAEKTQIFNKHKNIILAQAKKG